MKTLVSAFALLAFLAVNTLTSDAYAQPAAGATTPAPGSAAPAAASPTPSTKHTTHKTTKHTAKKKNKSKPMKSSTANKKPTQSSLVAPGSPRAG